MQNSIRWMRFSRLFFTAVLFFLCGYLHEIIFIEFWCRPEFRRTIDISSVLFLIRSVFVCRKFNTIVAFFVARFWTIFFSILSMNVVVLFTFHLASASMEFLIVTDNTFSHKSVLFRLHGGFHNEKHIKWYRRKKGFSSTTLKQQFVNTKVLSSRH